MLVGATSHCSALPDARQGRQDRQGAPLYFKASLIPMARPAAAQYHPVPPDRGREPDESGGATFHRDLGGVRQARGRAQTYCVAVLPELRQAPRSPAAHCNLAGWRRGRVAESAV